MNKQDTWEIASLSTFNIAKESPYLEKNLSVTGTNQLYDDKKRSGYEDGIKLAQSEIDEYKKTLDEIFRNIQNSIQHDDAELIQAITQLSLSIAKQIIRRELQVNSEQVISVVREAIKALPLEKTGLTIHLNPADVEIIQKVFIQDEATNAYSIIEDPSVSRGGCNIATENSRSKEL